jgi:hypothetical protein
MTKTASLVQKYIAEGTLPSSVDTVEFADGIRERGRLAVYCEIQKREMLPTARQQVRDLETSFGKFLKTTQNIRPPSFSIDYEFGWGVFDDMFRNHDDAMRRISETCARLSILRAEVSDLTDLIKNIRLSADPSDVFLRYFIGHTQTMWIEAGGADPRTSPRSAFVTLVGTAIDDFDLRDLLAPASDGDRWIDDYVRKQPAALESET